MHLEVLQSGEEILNDIFDTDVYEWVMKPFESIFVELAPDPPGDPNNTRVTLGEYMFPDFYVFALDIIDETKRPHRIP